MRPTLSEPVMLIRSFIIRPMPLMLVTLATATGCAICEDWRFEDRFSLVCADTPDDEPAPIPGCWTPDHQPILTIAAVEGPAADAIAVQGCAAIDPITGRCAAGPLAERGAPADNHLPVGAWTARAEGHRCADAIEGFECAAELGRAEALLVPVAGPAPRFDPQVIITCDDLPRPGPPLGDGPLPEPMVDDGAGGLIPDTVAHCAGLNGVQVYAADAPHRFRVWGPVEPVSPFEPAPSGGVFARQIAALLACTQRRCADRNTWRDPRAPVGDPLAACCAVPEGDDARCWVPGEATAPPSTYGLPGMLECPAALGEPVCTQQDRWPSIDAWAREVIDPEPDPEAVAEALAASVVTIEWLDVPADGGLPNAARNRQRIEDGRDYERYLKAQLAAKWPRRWRDSYRYRPRPLDIEMTYAAQQRIDGLTEAFPVGRSPGGAPARIQRAGDRMRHSDGFVQRYRRTHNAGTIVEAKCLSPFTQFDPRRQSWAWNMQLGFVAQLFDYINHARHEWRRRADVVPHLIVRYFFCEPVPHWTAQLMATATAATAGTTIFGWKVAGPPGATWVQTPIWHLDAMGLIDMVGTAIESWDGDVPWGAEGGDLIMNLTGTLYDQLSGSE